MVIPALLTSQVLLHGWAGHWVADSYQGFDLHVGYLIFHDFTI